MLYNITEYTNTGTFMKTLKKLAILFLISSWMIFTTGCSEEDSASCDSSLYCNNYNTSIKTCCTSTKCWYETNGNTFNCNGTSCSSAANSLANYCVGVDENNYATDLILEKAKNMKLTNELDDAYKSILKE